MELIFRVAWYRFRRTLRRRWLGYLSIVLLVGLLGGLAMGAVAGARRNQAAFPAFLKTAHASDVQFWPYVGGGSSPIANIYSPSLTRRIAALPGVRWVAADPQLLIAPIGPSGKPYLPSALQNNVVNTIGSLNGEYFTRDDVIADEGRVPDAGKVDEFAVTAAAAQLLHWHLGQNLSFGAFTFRQLASAGFGLPKRPYLRFDARLVGIVTFPDAVVHDEVDQYPTFALFTPALTNELLGAGAAGFPTYALGLDRGSGGVAAVERQLVHILPPGSTYGLHVTSVAENQVERATAPESIALGAFGLIAALAALLIAAQAIGRDLRASGSDSDVLRALGADPGMTTAESLFGVIGAIVLGAILAVGVCLALSSVAPIGLVREVDPAPGFVADWTVLGGGLAVFVGGLTVSSAAISRVAVRVRTGGGTTSSIQRPSRVVGGAIRLGLPVSAVAGIRFALERSRGRDAVPVGSALLGAVVAVAVVVTTLTFGSGLSTLVSHPSLYGWNWSYAIEEEGGGSIPPVTGRLLGLDPDVARWTGYSFASVNINGATVPALLTTTNAAVSPPILSGHGIEANDQIVLGGATLAQLHKRVGDTVTVSYGAPEDAPAYLQSRVQIVGTATMPAIGNPGKLHPSMGTGVLVSSGIEPPAFRKAIRQPDPNENGPDIIVVDLRNQVPNTVGLASLQRITTATDKVIAADVNAGGGTFSVLGVQQPAEIVDYRTMGATPAVLAAALAFGAIVALGLTLVASVRRRRRDLALLKTLGFSRRQLSAVVAGQASVTAIIGAVLGVPVGIALGRALWTVFAREINAVPQATVPVGEVALAAFGALVLANLVALVPGRIAARTPVAVPLRNE